MGNKHSKSRRDRFTQILHDLDTRPRIFQESNGERIGLFGEGIVRPEPLTQPTIPERGLIQKETPTASTEATPRPGNPERR